MALSGKLTAKQINQTSGPTTLNDGNGLYLKIRESGSRSWFCRIRHPQTKKLKDRGMGSYPEVTLIDARRMLPHIREQLIQETNARQKIPTFREYAELFIDRKSPEWRHPKHKQKWTNTLRNHAHPVIGDLPISEIDTCHLITLLTPIWTTKTETSMKLRQRIEMIINAATVEGFYNSPNPARWRGHLSHLLPNPNKIRKVTHYSSMPYQEVPSFIAALRQREGLSARLLEFVILTACRQSEARLATYDEIDQDTRIWTIPASRMKANREHRVPLTDRMLELIDECRTDSAYLFAENGNPLSINALRMLMNRMEVGEYTPHGFRSSFRTWGAELGTFDSEALEVALAHYSNSSIVSVYRRTDFIEERKCVLDQWHNYLAHSRR
jgi:integrase